MAEELFRRRLNRPNVRVESAGIAALIDHPADAMAHLIMQENNYDLSAHRARQATAQMLTEMDLILTLDQSHSDWIRIRFPFLLGRTHKLGRWSNNMDIVDPFRQPRAAFEQSFAQISSGVNEWVKRL